MGQQKWTLLDVSKHNSPGDCWMAIHGRVYNVTDFLSAHPGGGAVLLQNCARDASAAYDSVHPAELLEEHLRLDWCMGELDAPASKAKIAVHADESLQNFVCHGSNASQTLPVQQILSVAEMESCAMQKLSPKAISYYASGSDDEITKRENGQTYSSILLRPRILVDCTKCELQTTIFGNKVALPIFVAPAAMAKLAHPSGEAGIAAACSKLNAMQVISKNASMSPKDIVKAGPDAVFGWQLYVLKDIVATERTLGQIKAIPQIRFIVLTLDAPFPGKREADERFKMAEMAGGASPQIWGTEGGLTWTKTLAWLATQTELPIVLKGIQTHQDAHIATLFPSVRGIILSNHGGRALDTATTPIQVLLEIRKFCPHALKKLDVVVDGGITRGTDVVKALALGAKGVGVGRAALYGLAVGGQEGVERTVQILADETVTAMRLLGAENVTQLNPRHVNARRLEGDLFDGPGGLEMADQMKLAKL